MRTSDEGVMTKFICLPSKFQLSSSTPTPPPTSLLGRDMEPQICPIGNSVA